MLYVFHVEVGRMLNFDMTVALSSVENLKDTIERLHGIPAANIVLLVSGGEMLTHSTQVSYYSAGTDTNPIYMCLKGDVKLPYVPSSVMDGDLDLRAQVERSRDLPAVYETVVTRAQIALRMDELARDEERICERLVHEQHLQQQGWSAVVANMEDLTEEFRRRVRDFCVAFDRHLEKRPGYLELLRNFSDDVNKLSRIPILPGLMPLAEADFHGFDEFLDNDEVFSRSTNPQESVLMAAGEVSDATKKTDNGDEVVEVSVDTDEKSISLTSTSPNKKLKMGTDSTEQRVSQTSLTSSSTARRLNLLQWITSKENHNVLKTMSEECIQGLSTFNEDVYQKLKADVQQIIKLAELGDVKEIKGLSDRLCKLEELKYKIRGMVKDQRELSTAIQQNQNRAINLRDDSILPDLCNSHQSQLQVMLVNHTKIHDLRRCISKAKDELGSNLYTRLKRIVYIENAMSEFDNRLLFYHRCLRRAERHIHIIEQIHQAPNMYVAAVTEVLRRKIFSSEFRRWASKLSEDFDSIHSEEMRRRHQFNINFEGHFLNILFPGLNDMPPAFANEYPMIFDARLPNITRSDIDVLTSHLPEMTSQIQLPDMEPVIYFFVSRSGIHQRERFEELLKQRQRGGLKQITAEEEQFGSCKAMQSSGKDRTAAVNPRIHELRKDMTVGGGDESETDTETEFEQLIAAQQSVATSTFRGEMTTQSTYTDPILMQSAETLTEENMDSLRAEVARMRMMLGTMSKLALDCIQLARSNMQTFRSESVVQKEGMQSELQLLNEKWNSISMQFERKIAQAKEKRDQEFQSLCDQLKERELDLEDMKAQTKDMEILKKKCETMEAHLEELKQKIIDSDSEKQQAVAEAREKLIHEHKTEIESLRQRFKLMTSMERSPSDLSLEVPSDRSLENVVERSHHEAVISQMRAEMESDKEKAINSALEMERTLWQSKMFSLNSTSVMANVTVLKGMLEEKERQLEQLREKDLMLTNENFQLKTRLDALTNEDGNSWMREKIDYLNQDKCRLEEMLNEEKQKRIAMETSVAALKGSTYDLSPMMHSKSGASSQKTVVLDSCAKGDLVFVVWSIRHRQFMVVQDSPSLFFVHGDSLEALNLRLPQVGDDSIIPSPYYVIGRVKDKEYCQAKKDENRYRVTRGSKFYRIKLDPLISRHASRRERLESSTSFSRSVSQSYAPSDASTSASALDAIAASSYIGATTANVCFNEPKTEAGVAPISQASKERTRSITIASEEDEEPVSLISERRRYVSVCEEEEGAVGGCTLANAATAAASASTQTPASIATNVQQTTVITEQPTATASKLELDLMLASADINTTTPNITATATRDDDNDDDDDLDQLEATMTNTLITTTSTSMTDQPASEVVTPPPQIVVAGPTLQTQAAAILTTTTITSAMDMTDKICSPSIPTSIGTTTSEDSDEYRSLEAAKDDADFPISE